MHRTTIYLPDDLHQGLAALSECTGITLANDLCLAAEEVLAPHFAEVFTPGFRFHRGSQALHERAMRRKRRVDGRMNRRKIWRPRPG
jgi:hypothetical protein